MRRFADVGGSVYRRFFLEAPSACGTAVRAVAVFLRKQGRCESLIKFRYNSEFRHII